MTADESPPRALIEFVDASGNAAELYVSVSRVVPDEGEPR